MRKGAVLLAALAAVRCAPDVGAAGGPCRPDGRCGDGLVCFQGGCVVEGDDTTPIRIGFLAPVTGPFSLLGEAQREAMRLVADDVNQAGGVLGRRLLQPYLVDTGADPRTAADVAQALVDVEDVVAIVGPGTSPEVIDVGAVAARRRIPVVSSSAGLALFADPAWEAEPLFFRTGPSDEDRGRALAALADDEGCASLVVVRRDDAHGAGVAAGLREARVVVEVVVAPPSDALDGFRAAYRARAGVDPAPAAAAAYDAVALVALAMEAARSTDGAAIATALIDVSRGGARAEGGAAMDAPLDAVRAGDVDYAGPSGDVDLNDRGEAAPSFAPWTIVDGIAVAGDAVIFSP